MSHLTDDQKEAYWRGEGFAKSLPSLVMWIMPVAFLNALYQAWFEFNLAISLLCALGLAAVLEAAYCHIWGHPYWVYKRQFKGALNDLRLSPKHDWKELANTPQRRDILSYIRENPQSAFIFSMGDVFYDESLAYQDSINKVKGLAKQHLQEWGEGKHKPNKSEWLMPDWTPLSLCLGLNLHDLWKDWKTGIFLVAVNLVIILILSYLGWVKMICFGALNRKTRLELMVAEYFASYDLDNKRAVHQHLLASEKHLSVFLRLYRHREECNISGFPSLMQEFLEFEQHPSLINREQVRKTTTLLESVGL